MRSSGRPYQQPAALQLPSSPDGITPLGILKALALTVIFFALLRVAVRDEMTTFPEITVVFDGELGRAARRETDPADKAHRPAARVLGSRGAAGGGGSRPGVRRQARRA